MTTPGPPPAPPEWGRLSARMLLVHPVQEAVRFLPALVVVFFLGRGSDRSPLFDLGLLAVIVLYGGSKWFTTRFRVTDTQVELRSGLFERKTLVAPIDRVRSIDLSASIWHRLLRLAAVEVGTASGGLMAQRISLDALDAHDAARLREELLRRRGLLTAQPDADPARPPGPDEPAGQPAEPAGRHTPGETELVRLDPSWIRYAPLTTSGLVSALAIYGFLLQYGAGDGVQVKGAVDRLVGLGALAAVTLAAVVVVGAVGLLAVTAYVMSYWNFRLTRTPGTLQVSRGLTTTRSTTLEEQRLRGVELIEPFGLRLAGAASLRAVTTGIRSAESGDASGGLVPPAERAVVERVALQVVQDWYAVRGDLVGHGPAARRRRYVRAMVPTLLLAVGVLVAHSWLGLPRWVVVVGCLPLVLSPVLAHDRYAALGHRLTDRHLVARSGSIVRRREIVARRGAIGVVVRRSFFQRRAGLATVVLATAAGRQGYDVLDVPDPLADGLVTALVPEAAQFRGASLGR